MSNRFMGRLVGYSAVAVLALVAGAGCNRKSTTATPGGPGATAELTPGITSAPTGENPPPVSTTTTKTTAPPSWPTPEDCISYNPNNLTVHYEAGIHSINDGSKVVMRLAGGPGDPVGPKGLALAQRYNKHCFLGRNNTRTEDRNAYIFDYWRNLSGLTPNIPDQEEDCSPYDRTNLTVEDMGSGYGWRVKDHDHVLHLFDNESDARNGKLVLAKYNKICFIGDSGDDDPDVVSYSL